MRKKKKDTHGGNLFGCTAADVVVAVARNIQPIHTHSCEKGIHVRMKIVWKINTTT